MTAYEPKKKTIERHLEYILSLIRMFYRINENGNQIERQQDSIVIVGTISSSKFQNKTKKTKKKRN